MNSVESDQKLHKNSVPSGSGCGEINLPKSVESLNTSMRAGNQLQSTANVFKTVNQSVNLGSTKDSFRRMPAGNVYCMPLKEPKPTKLRQSFNIKGVAGGAPLDQLKDDILPEIKI